MRPASRRVTVIGLTSLFGLLACLIASSTSVAQQDSQIAFEGPTSASLAPERRSSDASYEQLRVDAESISLPFRHIKNVIRVVRPSVVHIEAMKTVSSSGASQTIEEAGAGVLFRLPEFEGRVFVLTNRHVIRDAASEKIRVQLADGRFFHPTQVWSDRGSDLAVLESALEGLQPCHLGRSETVEVGDFVIAIGSPFGLNHSATYGIVSAKGRRNLQLGDEGVRYQDFIQTDAAINPGNSGGPLLDLSGEVIGINTAIASHSGSNEGVGFTIPIEMAKKIAQDLINQGHVTRAFLGVSLDSAFTPEVASQLGLETIYGARVADITTDSPAEAANLKRGDVILTYEGQTIEDDSHLVQAVSMTPVGSKVWLDVYRDGQTIRLSTTLQDRHRFDPRR